MSHAKPEDLQGPLDIVAAVEAGKADVLEACVACGKCFQVCPTVTKAGLAGADPESTTAVRGDRFKQIKALGDIDAVMAELAPEIARAGLSEADARRLVQRDILGEQPLPFGGGP